VTFTVPDGLMQHLVFTDDAVPPDQVPPRIPADLPVVFSPGDDEERSGRPA
jgi:hypothetical protein